MEIADEKIAGEREDLDNSRTESPDAGDVNDNLGSAHEAGTRLMSFEQAIAAGLVPAHLSNQE